MSVETYLGIKRAQTQLNLRGITFHSDENYDSDNAEGSEIGI